MNRELPHAFRRRTGRPALVGHRGVRDGGFDENTLEAVEEAKRQGADAVEVDVRPCASGEIVVFHDPDLARMAGQRRDVADLPWSELKRVQLARSQRIPLLADVLALTRELGLGLNVELKHDVPQRSLLVAPAAALLRPYATSLDLVVSSFDPTTLVSHRLRLPSVCHALLVHESTYHDWALRIARGLRVGVHAESSLVVPARAAPALARGFLNAWTVNDAREAARIAALGVDAIITDRPAFLRAALTQ